MCLEPDPAADSSGSGCMRASSSAQARVETVPTALLSRQINDVVAQVETLTLRLETAGILPSTEEVANPTWGETQESSGAGTADS